jgi:hypothetical protein
MLRYLVPLLLFGAAGYVWYYNSTHVGESMMLLPFLDLVPAFEGDFPKQAEWSWRILAGIGGILLLITFGVDLTSKKRERAEDE